MGVDIHFYITKYNYSNKKWESVTLYKKDSEPIRLYPYRDYELFDILCGNANTGFPNSPIDENSLPSNLLKIYKEDKNNSCYDFYEVSFADLLVFSLKHNNESLEELIKYVRSILELYYDSNFYEINRKPSLVKLVYWFDR